MLKSFLFLALLVGVHSYFDFCSDQSCFNTVYRIYPEQCYYQQGLVIYNDSVISFLYMQQLTYTGFPAVYFYPDPCSSWNFIIYVENGPGCYPNPDMALNKTFINSLRYVQPGVDSSDVPSRSLRIVVTRT